MNVSLIDLTFCINISWTNFIIWTECLRITPAFTFRYHKIKINEHCGKWHEVIAPADVKYSKNFINES